MISVTKRSHTWQMAGATALGWRRPYAEEPEIVLESQQLGEGTIETLDLEHLDALFAEGDLGEVQFILDPNLPESKLKDVEKSAEELGRRLKEAGAMPWPGQTSIVHVSWPHRLIVCRFQQANPFFAVLARVLIALAGFAIPYAKTLLRTLIPWLRRLPFGYLIPTGLVLFTFLAPEGSVWRLFRWVGKQVGRVVREVGKGIAGGLAGLAEGLGGGNLILLLGAGGLVLFGATQLKGGLSRGR